MSSSVILDTAPQTTRKSQVKLEVHASHLLLLRSSCARVSSGGVPSLAPLAVPSSPNTAADIIVVDFLIRGLQMVGKPRKRLAISAEVGGTQRREAASKKEKMSAMYGRTAGSPSQHFSASIQTSSDRPKISRFGGRVGRSPAETSPGTRREGT